MLYLGTLSATTLIMPKEKVGGPHVSLKLFATHDGWLGATDTEEMNVSWNSFWKWPNACSVPSSCERIRAVSIKVSSIAEVAIVLLRFACLGVVDHAMGIKRMISSSTQIAITWENAMMLPSSVEILRFLKTDCIFCLPRVIYPIFCNEQRLSLLFHWVQNLGHNIHHSISLGYFLVSRIRHIQKKTTLPDLFD